MKVQIRCHPAFFIGLPFVLVLLFGCDREHRKTPLEANEPSASSPAQSKDVPIQKNSKNSHAENESTRVRSAPTQTVVPSTVSVDLALSFDGKDDYVDLGSLKYDGSHPLTIELTAIPRSVRPNGSNTHLDGTPTLVGDWGWTLKGFGIIVRADNFLWGIGFHDELTHRYVNAESAIPAEPQRRVQIAGVFNGTTSRLYIDGKLVGVSKNVDEYGPSDLPLLIGASWKVGGEFENHFDGIIDEMRVSNVARYTENYSPARRLAVDEHTLALYHCDEEEGEVLKDESPRQNDGRVVGASRVRADAVVASPGKTKP